LFVSNVTAKKFQAAPYLHTSTYIGDEETQEITWKGYMQKYVIIFTNIVYY